ncbi:MAG: ankyrin repeat domain-containing protein [Candidatus Xenobiia bacterium LiM19]
MTAHKRPVKKIIVSPVFFALLFFSLLTDCAFADMIDAVRGGRLEIVKNYLESDPSWEFYKSKYGWTLLHYAAHYQQADVAEFLLLKGADINARTDDNKTPLGLAVEGGSGGWFFEINLPHRKNTIDLLISHGAQINSLDEAIALDSVEILNAIISNNPESLDSFKKYNAALDRAACWGSKRVMSFLLKSHALAYTSVDLDKPMISASIFGYKDIVKLLLSYGVDANSNPNNNYTPLYRALTCGNGRVFVLYYDPRAGRYQSVNMQVQFCNPEDYIEIVKMLIAAGADVNVKPEHKTNPMKGTYPLQIAAIKGWTEMAELLLSAGARGVINEKDDVYHYTPLHHAAEQGNKALVELLVNNGADKEVKDDQGRTPLKIAEEKGHIEIVELLRSPGAKER